MSSINFSRDSESADYLNAIRKELAQARSKNTKSTSLLEYILESASAVNISNSFTNTQKTTGDYYLTDNSAKLIAHIPLDYDVLDASNANDGTVTGTTTWIAGPVTAPTQLRKAFDFDGSSYITLANESNFDFNRLNTFSISAWVKKTIVSLGTLGLESADTILMENGDQIRAETSGANVVIISKIASTATAGYYLMIDGDGLLTFILQNSTSDKIEVISTTSLNSLWNNLVVTYSGSGLASGVKIYLNGVEDTLSTITNTSTLTALNNVAVIIGALGDASKKIVGGIDEVQIWNENLTAANCLDLASSKQINKNSSVTNPAIIGLSDII